MRKILRLALNDVRLTLRDRASFVWMLVLPLFLMWIFGNIGGGGGTPKASLTIVDRDGGWLARALVAELGRDEQFRVREMTEEEAGAAEDKVRTLYLPGGFTRGVLDGLVQRLRLEKDPETSEEFALAVETRIIRVAVSALGRLVEMDQQDLLAGGSAEEVAARFEALGERESLVDLDVSTAGRGRPVPSGRAQSVPGILTMTVMMMTLIYGAVFLTEEKRTGTLRRQMTLPVGRRHVFAGKLVGRFVIAALQTVVLLLAGRFAYGISFGRSLVALVVLMACYCVSVAGLSTLLGALLRTPEQAGGLGWLLGMVLAALGGCWWPSEMMPRWMWTAAHALPTAWAMDGFHRLISFGYGLESVLVPSLVLLAFGAAFSLAGARWLRTAGGGV